MSFNLRTYQTIYNSIKAYIIAHQNIITDFNDGSVISSQIEAFSRQLSQAYAEDRAGFTDVLKKLPYSVFDFSSKVAVAATGSVTFTRSDTTSAVTIPSGTQLSTSGGVEFQTTADAAMAVGTATVTAAIEAATTGTTGNVSAGAITVIVSSVDADSVTNPSATAGGVDAETSSEALSRFRAYLMGVAKSNKYGVIYGALLNTSLRSASIVEHFPPKTDLYNFTLYVEDGNGTANSTIISSVRNIIDGDGTETNPGYRAAGINCDILAPTLLSTNVNVSVTINYNADKTTATTEITSIIEDYLNGLTIGESFIRSKLMKSVLNYSYATDLTISSPTDNITVSDGQIIRAGTITLLVTQESS